MPLVHAKDFSASASSRWLTCAASVIEVRKYQNRSSIAAEEGTCAHELGEIGLAKNLDESQLREYINKTLNDAPSVAVNAEMVDYVWGYIEYCRSFAGDMFVEVRVDYSPWAEDGFGTSDCIVIGPERGAVIDLKYGKGITVSAENNTQAMLYGLGAVNEYDFIYDFADDYVFELHIYQPRVNNFSQFNVTVGELRTFGEVVRAAVEASKRDNPSYSPSEKGCLWCAHKGNCVALQQYTESTIMSVFDDLDLPEPETIDFENVLKNKKLIESWLKAVEGVVFDRLMSGGDVPGYKLVAGRGSRKWLDEQQVTEVLETKISDGAYTKKLLTVPQAEKKLGKAMFNELCGDMVLKTEGGPTLTHSSDTRRSIGCVVDDFEVI